MQEDSAALEADSDRRSVIVGEYVAELDLEFAQNCLQLIQGYVVLPSFDAMEGRVRNSRLLCEIRVRQTPSRRAQVAGELSIETSLHVVSLAEWSSRMRDDLTCKAPYA